MVLREGRRLSVPWIITGIVDVLHKRLLQSKNLLEMIFDELEWSQLLVVIWQTCFNKQSSRFYGKLKVAASSTAYWLSNNMTWLSIIPFNCYTKCGYHYENKLYENKLYGCAHKSDLTHLRLVHCPGPLWYYVCIINSCSTLLNGPIVSMLILFYLII